MATVFLPVESTVRELDYKLNLARYFCKEGYEVILGNPSFIREQLKFRAYKGIFLEKGLNPTPEYYKMLQEKGILLYDLSDEGAAQPVYSINYDLCTEALKYMRKIFLWGEAQKKDLIARNSDPLIVNKYQIVGSPAFDLSLPKYRYLHQRLKPQELPTSYILINTNFGSVNGHNIEEQLEACSGGLSPLSYQMMVESYERETAHFKIFKQWLDEIFIAFPNEYFLIRPHPTEIEENYKNLFSAYSNVHVSKKGNVNQIIADAKMVLHKDCSTALQSYLMGCPVIAIGGSQINISSTHQWSLAFGAQPETIEEAKKLIEYALDNKGWNQQLQAKIDENAKVVLNTYFNNIGNSSKTLVEIITNDAKKYIKDFDAYKIVDSRPLFQKLKLFVRKLLPLHYKVPKAARETLIKFSKNDILIRLALFETVEPLGIEFKVEKKFPNTFLIMRKKK